LYYRDLNIEFRKMRICLQIVRNGEKFSGDAWRPLILTACERLPFFFFNNLPGQSSGNP